jgi:hypothetical protein
MIEEIKNISSTKNDIHKFSNLVGGILIAIGLFLLWKSAASYLIILCTGAALIIIGKIFPVILKPIYMTWMVFAVILGWIMTRVILTILFYLVVTPISLIAKLFRRKFLDLSFRTNADTYWNYRGDTVSDIEKQF